MKNTKKFPLSFDEIAKMLGNKNEVEPEFEGIVLLKKSQTKSDLLLVKAVSNKVFENVYNVFKSGDGVVVGKDKLLTDARVINCEVKEQADSIEGLVVMRVKVKALIASDPSYAVELKESLEKTPQSTVDRVVSVDELIESINEYSTYSKNDIVNLSKKSPFI